MAKGLSSGYSPIGAVALADNVSDVLYESGQDFTHGFTYSGHPVACAVALENIRLLEEGGLVDRAAELAPYFKEKLESLAAHPIVGEVRAVGLLGAIELSPDKATRAQFDELGRVGSICRDHCMSLDLVSRACRDTMVLSPPFVITKEEIDELVSRLEHALNLTLSDVKSEMVG